MSVDGKVSEQLEKSGFAALTLAHTCGVWDRHLENFGTALENALALIEGTIKDLNAELSKRENK